MLLASGSPQLTLTDTGVGKSSFPPGKRPDHFVCPVRAARPPFNACVKPSIGTSSRRRVDSCSRGQKSAVGERDPRGGPLSRDTNAARRGYSTLVVHVHWLVISCRLSAANGAGGHRFDTLGRVSASTAALGDGRNIREETALQTGTRSR